MLSDTPKQATFCTTMIKIKTDQIERNIAAGRSEILSPNTDLKYWHRHRGVFALLRQTSDKVANNYLADI